MRNLTDSEKIAIHYAVLTNYDDWNVLYKVAIGEERYNKMTTKSKTTSASKWKNSQEVQEEYRTRQYDEHKRREEERQKEEESRRETESPKGGESSHVEQVNFLDRDEFLKFLNARANEIKDDKLKNDILKMLSDNLRYKDGGNDEENEIQRFYTPITCNSCPLYREKSGN